MMTTLLARDGAVDEYSAVLNALPEHALLWTQDV